MNIRRLDAGYNDLGTTGLSRGDAQANVDAQQAALDAGTGYAPRLKAEEATLAKQTAKVETITADLRQLQTEAGKAAMPAAKLGEAQYDAAFKAACEQTFGDGGGDGEAAAKALTAALKAVVVPATQPGVKSSRQPSKGLSLAELQAEGLAEIATFWKTVILPVYQKLGIDPANAGGFYDVKKDGTRALLKAKRWGGDLENVSDWGRATSLFQTLPEVATFVPALLEALAEHGYTVATIKNTLDVAAPAWKSGGYRNILINVAAPPRSGHVLELQLNLAGMETIKHGKNGHVVYEVLRKAGYGDRTEFTGGFTAMMGVAIESGRARKLELSSTMCNDPKEAAGLTAALSASDCRVNEIAAGNVKGDARGALSAACLGPTVRKVQ